MQRSEGRATRMAATTLHDKLIPDTHIPVAERGMRGRKGSLPCTELQQGLVSSPQQHSRRVGRAPIKCCVLGGLQDRAGSTQLRNEE